jgi:hypothetical protein
MTTNPPAQFNLGDKVLYTDPRDETKHIVKIDKQNFNHRRNEWTYSGAAKAAVETNGKFSEDPKAKFKTVLNVSEKSLQKL